MLRLSDVSNMGKELNLVADAEPAVCVTHVLIHSCCNPRLVGVTDLVDCAGRRSDVLDPLHGCL